MSSRHLGLPEEAAKLGGKCVLVTGGAGAIGGNLIKALDALGCRVRVVDDFSSGDEANLHGLHNNVVLIAGDLASSEVLEKAFSGRVDIVFHLAAFFANQNSVEHPQDDLHTNGMGTLELARQAAAHRVERLVYSSSSCVYGGQGGRLRETHALKPETPYAITKILGEQYCQFYRSHAGLSTTCLRFFNSYGPGEGPGRYRNVVPNFFAKALAGKALTITGSGEETRDFTFVEDIVKGILLAAVRPEADGEVFNLGTGRESRIVELAEQINRISGNTRQLEYLPRRSWDHTTRRCADISKAERLLGYRPGTSLAEGLRRTHRWFVERYLASVDTAHNGALLAAG